MINLSSSWSCWPKYVQWRARQFYRKSPRNVEILSGQDNNSNVGTWSEMFLDALGTNGIDNRNTEGNYFLFLLWYNKFRLLLSYFKHDNYVTWHSFNAGKTPYMLENSICAKSCFSQVSDCKLIDTGTHSDHSLVQIKFKWKENVKVQVDCTTIGKKLEINKLFNFNSFQIIPKEPTYTQFNQCITKAAEMTDPNTKQKIKASFVTAKTSYSLS